MRIRIVAMAVAAAALAVQANGQLRVSPQHKFSWQENTGWMNWFDAANGTQGVKVFAGWLGGSIWTENVGWLSLGDGVPGGPSVYTNGNGLDFGVNLDPITGKLSGYGWSENAGWVNFSGGALATPPNPARISLTIPRRFAGYAWSENLGWINLDHPTAFVEVNTCPADLNSDGLVDDADFVIFAAAYNVLDCLDPSMASGCLADLTVDGVVDDADFVVFAAAYNELLCP